MEKKVLKEIEENIGFTRYPSYADKTNMPFMSALMLETIRWIRHVPIALPHKTTKDTTICGYPIKKNTNVFVNIFSLASEKEIWGDPETFRPERFLADDGSLLSPESGARK